jgi:hypothetical protein
VSALQQELRVLDGSNWDRGKHIVICSADHCAEGRLALDGTRTSLSVTAPLGMAFPAGSEVFVSNRLRYYVTTGPGGTQRVMRQVDGGANTIIGDVTRFHLAYLNGEGKPTSVAGSVSRVRIDLMVGHDQHGIVSEIGLRGR